VHAIGGQRAIGQLDVDMLVGIDGIFRHVDEGMGEARLVSGRGLQEDALVQIDGLLLVVEQAGAGIERHGRAVFHQHFRMHRVQLDAIGIGDVLGRGLRPELIGALIGRVARQMRRFHGDLGAGYHEVSDVERQFRHQQPERVEDRGADDHRQRQDHRDRYGDAQDPHHPAVARGNGKARLEAGLIGGVLDRIHHSSKGEGCPIVPCIAALCRRELHQRL
jgi:hypothetical protein